MALFRPLLGKTNGKASGMDGSASDQMQIDTGGKIEIADSGGLLINSIASNATGFAAELGGDSSGLSNSASSTVQAILGDLDTAITAAEANTLAESMANSDAFADLLMDLGDSTAHAADPDAATAGLRLQGHQGVGDVDSLGEVYYKMQDGGGTEIFKFEHTATDGELRYVQGGNAWSVITDSSGAFIDTASVYQVTSGTSLTLNSGSSFSIGSTSGTLTLNAAGQLLDMNSAALDIDATGNITINTDGTNTLALTTAGGAMTLTSGGATDIALASGGDIDASTNTIKNVVDPTSAQDAATKAYVDAVGAGFAGLATTDFATAAVLSATVTYNNGTAGVGATITNADTQVALSVDGTAVAANDRILVKDSAASLQNGVYDVTNIGSGATNWVLTRSTDFDGSPAFEIDGGEYTFTTAGATNLNKGFVCTVTSAVTVGTDAITFTQFSAVEPITASLGAERSGNDIRLDLLAAGGLKLTGNEVGIEPNDFAGTGLEDDGSDNMRLAAQGTGINGGAGSTLSVNYGSASGSAVQGDTTFAMTAGAGLTGGQASTALGGAVSYTVDVATGSSGLVANANDISMVLGTNSGLQETSADADYGTGITVDQDSMTNVYVNATSTTTASDRDVLVMNASGTIVPGDADDSFADKIVGIANGAHSADANATVFNAPGQRISGFSGLTPGARQYIDATTAGGLTETAPSAVGQQVTQVGFAISATEIVYMPHFHFEIT